jgi:hypothetical protein
MQMLRRLGGLGAEQSESSGEDETLVDDALVARDAILEADAIDLPPERQDNVRNTLHLQGRRPVSKFKLIERVLTQQSSFTSGDVRPLGRQDRTQKRGARRSITADSRANEVPGSRQIEPPRGDPERASSSDDSGSPPLSLRSESAPSNSSGELDSDDSGNVQLLQIFLSSSVDGAEHAQRYSANPGGWSDEERQTAEELQEVAARLQAGAHPRGLAPPPNLPDGGHYDPNGAIRINPGGLNGAGAAAAGY